MHFCGISSIYSLLNGCRVLLRLSGGIIVPLYDFLILRMRLPMDFNITPPYEGIFEWKLLRLYKCLILRRPI